jgi:diacylglycerol O-acyltransferase 1
LDPDDSMIEYPQNITWQNMLYFMCAPTLTYQIAFPKSKRVRIWKIVGILLRLMVCMAIFTFLSAQVVTPALEGIVRELEATHGTYTLSILADYALRLSIPNTYLWLLMFYSYFHLYLNLLAEILRFGDRVFYKDWWNASEVSAYWRLWNMPVHYWLIRHLYYPCIRWHMSRHTATLIVFLVSAVFHEILVSIPFHMVRPWSFLGMMMQIPLVATTKYLYRRYPGSSIGNVIFWITFCVVGQPMAVLLYTIDYQYGKSQALMMMGTMITNDNNIVAVTDQQQQQGQQCRIAWDSRCLVR